MAAEIRVPVLGESVVEATVGRWLKQEGDPVKAGESLVELETDKINVEVPADGDGVLARIDHREGETVHPGDIIGAIGEGSGAPAAAPAAAAAPKAEVAAAAAPKAEAAPADEEEVRASPLAQKVAEELHVDLSKVPASGPGGKVTREDVQAFARGEGNGKETPAPPVTEPRMPGGEPAAAGQQQAPTPAPAATRPAPAPAPPVSANGARGEKRQRLSRRRLTIAHRLVEAQHNAAMLTTFNEVDMTAIMAIRKRRKEKFQEKHGVGLGFMSFFTKAVVAALKDFPQVNAELQGDELILKEYYDIGIAIGDPEGLVVPVVRNAEKLSFAGIEQAIVGFVKKAKDRALSLEDLRGGTFTITNGGVFGSLLSTPILNPPQVAILGMHKIQERPVAVNGEVVIRPMMYLALSYDHRVVDGREAVQFLVRIKDLLEDPDGLLLES